jgi:hypothetical protein
MNARGDRLQQLAIPTDELGVFFERLRLGQVIRDRLRARSAIGARLKPQFRTQPAAGDQLFPTIISFISTI